MGTFISPDTKFGFTRIFGQESHKQILLSFMNAVHEGKYRFENVTYQDPEVISGPEKERRVIHDIFCTLDDGTPVIVEMQNKDIPKFDKRALYFLSQGVLSLERTMASWRHPALGIYLMGFKQEALGDDYRNEFAMRPTLVMTTAAPDALEDTADSNLESHDMINFTFIQMPYFNKAEADCQTDLDKWLYILKNMTSLDHIPWADQCEVFSELAEVASISGLTAEERKLYEESCACLPDSI